jgi:carbon monoxide dehydrogenase subunit G
LNIWIELKRVSDNETRLKLVARGEMLPFVRQMLSSTLQGTLEKISDILAVLPY